MQLLSSYHTGHIQRRRGQSLVGLLVVAVIMIALYFMFLGPRQDASGERRPSVARQSIDRAKETSLDSNLSQIRTAIMMFKNDNDRYPNSLDELKNSSYGKGFPPEMWVNPLDKKPLYYDPTTGQVSAQPIGSAAGAPPTNPGAPGTAPADGSPTGTINIPQPKEPVEPSEP